MFAFIYYFSFSLSPFLSESQFYKFAYRPVIVSNSCVVFSLLLYSETSFFLSSSSSPFFIVLHSHRFFHMHSSISIYILPFHSRIFFSPAYFRAYFTRFLCSEKREREREMGREKGKARGRGKALIFFKMTNELCKL